MKLRALLLTTALIAIGAAAHAGTPHSFGANAGLVLPTGDLSDAVGTGYLIGASYEYRFDPRFGAGLDVDYFALGEQSTSTTYLGSTRTVKQEAPGGQAILFGRYYFTLQGSSFSPYVSLALEKVRIGFKSTVSYRGSTVEHVDRQDKPGLGLSVGATRPLNDRLTGGLELGFHQIQTRDESTHLVTLALSCSFTPGK